MKEISIDADIYQVLVAYNVYNRSLIPVDKLLNGDEVSSILYRAEYDSKVYSLPYLFFVHQQLAPGDEVVFAYNGEPAFVVRVERTEIIDKSYICELIFGVSDTKHPGVSTLMSSPPYLLSGWVTDFTLELDLPHTGSSVDLSGKSIFQSRNPPHRGHETIIAKYAPNLVYTTPYITTKSSDYSFDIKIQTYKAIQNLYGVTILTTTLPRLFAGPVEALQNCLLFQNMGAVKFIMGRGKNCIDGYHQPDEAYNLCRKFYEDGRITIEPIWQEDITYNGVEIKGSTIKTQYIDKGESPPPWLMSEYISEILLHEHK